MYARHAFALVVALSAVSLVLAQGKTSDQVVKATAKAEAADADGKQVVTITLEIDKEYHIYANPIDNEDLVSNQTTLTIAGGKAKLAKIDYPAGKIKADKVIGDYKIYKDKVTIKATVQRAKGETGPIELGIKVQACTDKACLAPGTLKLKVE